MVLSSRPMGRGSRCQPACQAPRPPSHAFCIPPDCLGRSMFCNTSGRNKPLSRGHTCHAISCQAMLITYLEAVVGPSGWAVTTTSDPMPSLPTLQPSLLRLPSRPALSVSSSSSSSWRSSARSASPPHAGRRAALRRRRRGASSSSSPSHPSALPSSPLLSPLPLTLSFRRGALFYGDSTTSSSSTMHILGSM